MVQSYTDAITMLYTIKYNMFLPNLSCCKDYSKPAILPQQKVTVERHEVAVKVAHAQYNVIMPLSFHSQLLLKVPDNGHKMDIKCMNRIAKNVNSANVAIINIFLDQLEICLEGDEGTCGQVGLFGGGSSLKFFCIYIDHVPLSAQYTTLITIYTVSTVLQSNQSKLYRTKV